MSFTGNFLSLSIVAALTLNFPTSFAYEFIMEGDSIDELEESLADFYGDEEFVSIATGTKKAIHKAPSTTTVITAEDIKMMGANSVFEILETVTGIHIYPSNLDRMKPNFSIRGIHTSENPQTLLLVNGEKTTYEYTGARWEQFNVGINLIDRIEIIRGPGSAVYGADAFSGVINIITKGVDAVSGSDFGVKAGSFNTKSSWFNIVDSDNTLKYSLNAQWSKTDGDEDRIVQTDAMHTIGLGFLSNAPSAFNTKLETIDIHAQLSYLGFYAKAWYLNNEGGTGAGAAQALSSRDIEKTDALTLSSGYKWDASENLTIDFSAHYQEYNDDTYFVIYPAGMALPRAFNEQGIPTKFTVFTEGLIGQPIAQEKHYGANLVSHYSSIEQHTIRAEVGYRYSEAKQEEYKNFGPGVLNGTEDFKDGTLTNVTGTPHIYMQNQDRELYFVSLQDEWALAADWELTAGVRYDNYSDFGGTLNPRLALVWQTQHNLTTKVLYGEAFRAPSFQELYAINNPIVLGNPNLEPENIKTTEVAFDYRPTFDWQIMLNLYTYQADNLISWVPQGNGTNVANNVGSQDGYGAELEAKWQPIDSLKIKAGYTWQTSEDKNSKETIADAPGQTFDINVNWTVFENISLHADSRFIMNRERSSLDTRANIDDYNVTNLAVSYKISSEWNTQLSIRNIFDSTVYEPSDGQIEEDYPMDSRGLWLNIQYTL